jgi:hydrogenase maturation factor
MLYIKIKNRINWFCKNKINDFSPTISPAPKKRESNEIESISQAIRYFLENDITEIVVQKKYMGSYCSIYLKKNLEETYFVSRNGFKIQHINNEEALESIKNLHQKMCNQFPDFDTIIIAAELLP